MIRKSLMLGLAALLMSQPAEAATMFNLTLVDPLAGLGSVSFGTVSVTENANGSLTFLETLTPGFKIHDGTSNHNAFSFSIAGDPTVTVSSLTAGFAAISTSSGINVSAPPFGSFFTAIDCTTSCGPGYNGGYAGTLSFTVSAAKTLTLQSLGFNTINGHNVYFTTDVVNASGYTGNVGAAGVVAAVPEPATWALMLVGFGGVGYSMRRRKQGHMTAVTA